MLINLLFSMIDQAHILHVLGIGSMEE